MNLDEKVFEEIVAKNGWKNPHKCWYRIAIKSYLSAKAENSYAVSAPTAGGTLDEIHPLPAPHTQKKFTGNAYDAGYKDGMGYCKEALLANVKVYIDMQTSPGTTANRIAKDFRDMINNLYLGSAESEQPVSSIYAGGGAHHTPPYSED